MTPEMAIPIGLSALAILLIVGVPIALALGVSGALGLLLLTDVSIVGSTVGAAPYGITADHSLLIIPMFIFMGVLAAQAGIARDVLYLANKVFRRIPGGLGLATIAACSGFAAVTGSSVATAATVGRVAIGEMVGYGYRRSFAAGIVGSAGTLGVLIPPSIILVLYGIITGESIGALLLAGIIPGLFTALIYAIYVIARSMIDPRIVHEGATAAVMDNMVSSESTVRSRGASLSVASKESVDASMRLSPPGENDSSPSPDGASGERPRPVSGLLKIVILFTVVMGGIYSGIFTATESGALGAVAALVMMTSDPRIWRAGYLSKLAEALREAASTAAMIFLILIGAAIFTTFLVQAGAPNAFTDAVLDIPAPPHLTVALLLLALVPMGMFLDGFSILVIAVPLIYPVATDLGFDGIWLGVLVVKMIEIGLITPPVGINAFVLATVDAELSVEAAFRGLFPFVLVEMVVVAILFAFPWLSLVIPGTL